MKKSTLLLLTLLPLGLWGQQTEMLSEGNYWRYFGEVSHYYAPETDDQVYVTTGERTADGYIPFVFKYYNGNIYLQEGDMINTCNVTGCNVIIGDDFLPDYTHSSIKVDGTSKLKGNQGVEIKKNFEVPIGSKLEILTGN